MKVSKFPRRWKYGALVNISAQDAIAYRVTMIIDWIVNLWSVLVMLYIWGTVFVGATTRLGEFDWQEMKTYLVIAHALNVFVVSGVSWLVAGQIRDGSIVTDLTRPIDYISAKFVEQFGGSLMNGVAGSGLVALLSIIFFNLLPPPSLIAAMLFIVSALLGYVVSFLIGFVLALSAAWLMNNEGIGWMVWFASRLLSGTVIPLSLFPDWLRGLPGVLPFRATVSDPLTIYLGHATGVNALAVLGIQMFWIVVLYAGVRWLLPKALRRLDIMGG